MATSSPLAGSFRPGRLRNNWRERGRGQGRVSPALYAPYAWYDAKLASDATGLTDQSTYGRAAMTVGAGAAAPVWLSYAAPTVYFPANNNSFRNLAGTATTLGNTISWVWRGKMDATIPGTYATLGGQGTAGNVSMIYLQPGGAGLAYWIDSAGVQRNRSISGFTGLTTQRWHRVTIDATADPAVVTTHSSPDGDSPGVWTQITTANSTAGATGVRWPTPFDNGFIIGLLPSGTGNSIGSRINHFEAWRDGAVVKLWRASDMGQNGGTSGTDVWVSNRDTSGRKLTIQSTPANTAEALYLLATDDKFDGPTAAIPPCANSASASMFSVIRPWDTQTSGVIFTTRSGAGAGVTLRMASSTTIVADVSDGTTTNTTGAASFTPGQRLVAGVHLDAAGVAYVTANNTIGSTVARPSGTQAGGVLVVGADSTPANFLDAECRAPWYALDRLATPTVIADLVGYYLGGL